MKRILTILPYMMLGWMNSPIGDVTINVANGEFHPRKHSVMSYRAQQRAAKRRSINKAKKH